MRIEKKELITFLKKVKLNASNGINEFRLNFKEEGLEMAGVSATNYIMVHGLLKKEAFIEYSPIGQKAISDVQDVIKVIDRFDKELEIVFTASTMEVRSGKKEVVLNLTDLSVISEPKPLPTFKLDETFKIDIKSMNSILDDTMMSKDASLIISSKPGMIVFSNTGKFKFTNQLLMEGIVGEQRVKVGQPIIDALYNITEDLQVSFKTDFPIKFVEETDKSKITIIVAPLVSED